MIASPSTNKLSPLFPNVQDSGSGQGDAIPQPVVFVEDLSDRLANDFPDLWKLGQVELTVLQIFKLLCDFTNHLRCNLKTHT
jgi:hypothetical protein